MNMNKILDRLRTEIERRLEKYDPDYTNAGSELKELLSFVTSLQQEKNCIFGNIPSEDACSFCSAYADNTGILCFLHYLQLEIAGEGRRTRMESTDTVL